MSSAISASATLSERRIGVSDRTVDLIGEGVDCVLRGGELTDLSLMARRVAELQLGIYAAPDYLQQFGTPWHPQEMGGPDHFIVGFTWSRAGKVSTYALHPNGRSLQLHG